ncbi:Uu.00g049980.m01.CDS01 [Anthostomella pinea]|uniref:Uu.00g049980.m01.CDS01 n=1 Tax=Anthostomella pinea TaxID=933095 RepID=A0AAI8VC00_9PEZI|nr:Uu.00g049980.m01.CDS01 [Anthostomella pinea]
MYAGNYGFPNNAAAAAAGSPYNGAPPPGSQNTPLQPGSAPNHMMYNSQQFPMGVPPGAGFPGNPNAMPGAGPAGMMQSTGMPHMAAANGQMPNYQTPYSTSPYGGGVPSSVAPQMNVPPNYAMGGGMPMAGLHMQPGMNAQQQQQQMMQQRMQSAQSNAGSMSTPTPQRNFQSQSSQRTPTPNSAQPSQQSQFAPPQNAQGPQQSQTPNNAQPHPQPQPQPSLSNNIQTPQTPTFPSSIQGSALNGTSSGSAPLSPVGDSRDKERVGVILEINNELLLEAMQIQNTQQILKKERSVSNGTDGTANEAEKLSEEEEILAQDYLQCMRRLQSNLAYLAALADKKGGAAAPNPAYLRAPTLNTSVKLRQMPGADENEVKAEAPTREETAKYMAELYSKLQGLYPGVDPSKEPVFPATAGRPGAAKPGTQTPGQSSPVPGKQKTPKLASSAPQQQVATAAAAHGLGSQM